MHEIKLNDEDARKLAALRQALIEGEESGRSSDFDFEEFLAQKREAHGKATA